MQSWQVPKYLCEHNQEDLRVVSSGAESYLRLLVQKAMPPNSMLQVDALSNDPSLLELTKTFYMYIRALYAKFVCNHHLKK